MPQNFNALTAQELLKLQSTIGNQAVQRLIAGQGNDVVQRSALSSPARNRGFDVNVAKPSAGEQLPEDVQERMESAFDTDFSNVQVHEDGQAENLGAYAFAHGDDIHFAQGTYNPHSPSGQQLIGHELTHVVQQREGRVSAPNSASGTSVVDDLSLEAEAHSLGAKAASAPISDRADGSDVRQAGSVKHPVVQGAWPVITAIGAALAKESAVAATTTIAAISGTAAVAASAGAAIMPENTGVQEVQLPNGWMSERDKQSLKLIIQYRIVNAYLQRIAPPVSPVIGPQEPTEADQGTGPMQYPGIDQGMGPLLDEPAQAPLAPGTDEQRAQLDAGLLEAIRVDIQRQIEEELNNNTQKADDEEFIWSDSGDHTADTFGTVGAIQFASMQGTYIEEFLNLHPIARDIPDLVLPAAGQTVIVKQFRGGVFERSPEMSTGWNDDLGINLAGGEPTYQQNGDNGHGAHLYDTAWNWDNNTTRWRFEITISDTGVPVVTEAGTQGTPDD